MIISLNLLLCSLKNRKNEAFHNRNLRYELASFRKDIMKAIDITNKRISNFENNISSIKNEMTNLDNKVSRFKYKFAELNCKMENRLGAVENNEISSLATILIVALTTYAAGI